MELDFDSLVEQYSQRVFNLAYRITGTRQDAEDVVQDTFLQAYEHRAGFRGDSDVFTWLFRIAFNNCMKLKKRMSRASVESLDEKVELFKDDIPLEVQQWYENPEKAAWINELLAEIRHGCLHFLSFRLPENQRIVYIMRNVLDFSYAEIAGILGIGENVVKARLNRARRSLAEYFSKRCQWLTDDHTCTCRTRIGFALAYDTEMLKRVREQAAVAGTDGGASRALYTVDELYGMFPEFQYQYKLKKAD